MFRSVLFLILTVFHKKITAETEIRYARVVEINNIIDTLNFSFEDIKDKRPNPIFQLLKKKQKTNKRITAAILAFPFPFGIVGLHRIYLGTAPHVPVVYIGSLGGFFGLLPFIDFCELLRKKDIDRYIENKKVFMWIN